MDFVSRYFRGVRFALILRDAKLFLRLGFHVRIGFLPPLAASSPFLCSPVR